MFTQREWFNPRETTIPETGTFGILEHQWLQPTYNSFILIATWFWNNKPWDLTQSS